MPPFKRLFSINKTLSLKERTGNFGSLLSIFPVGTSVEVDKAVTILGNGGVVGMPTETVYGLAGSIDSEKALQAIFHIKERPFFDPLIVHISDLSMLSKVVDTWPKLAKKLAEEFWPGPLTIVVPKSSTLNPMITSGLETVAVRMPAHPVALALISRLGVPVAAPSANKFGKTSPTLRSHVVESFPDVFTLEGGAAEIGLESTVVSVDGEKLTVLRPGFVTAEELSAATGTQVDVRSSVQSPGHLENHYQPEKPLVLVKKSQDEKEIAWQLSQLDFAEAKAGVIELPDDPFNCARILYQRLREGSASTADYLICYWRPEWKGGLWEAIGDRLSKASSHIL